jgi:BON domain
MVKTNTQLQNEVIEELKWEPCVTATEIGVSANNGVVTLSGTVPTFAEKFAAERATRRVAGVKAIAEEIQVTPFGKNKRSDQEIAEAARVRSSPMSGCRPTSRSSWRIAWSLCAVK